MEFRNINVLWRFTPTISLLYQSFCKVSAPRPMNFIFIALCPIILNKRKKIYTKGAQCTFPKRVQTKVFTIRMDKQWCSIHVEVFKQVSSILLFVLVVASTPPIMSLFFFFYLFFKKIPNTENLSIQFISLNKVKVLINIPTEN